MAHKIWPHQSEAYERIKDEARVALFMEMRMGKTPVIIRWAHHRTSDIQRPKILLIAPGQTLDDFQEELFRAGVPGYNVTRLDLTPSNTRIEYALGGWGWYLLHKEGARINEELADEDWDVVIVDESTLMRNPKAKITKVLINRYTHVPNRAIMTGDPRPEGELDYFEQFRFLYGDFMGYRNYWVFRNNRFVQSRFNKWDWMPAPGLRDEIKQYVHQHAVVMTKQQYGLGNERVFKKRVVELTDRQRDAMHQIINKFSFEYIETNFATVRDVWLARVAGGFSPDRENPELLSGAKADGIIDVMHGELRKEPSVIWFRFNEELRYVVDRLNKAKIKAIGVDGTTPKRDRKPIRDRFNDGTYRVICIQGALGKMGWNLSRADVSQYYSYHHDWEIRSQSLQRVEHLTKKRTLLVIDWVTRGTIDEDTVYALKNKQRSSRAFMRQLNSVMLDRLRSLYALEDPTKTSRHQTSGTQTKKIRRLFPGSR